MVDRAATFAAGKVLTAIPPEANAPQPRRPLPRNRICKAARRPSPRVQPNAVSSDLNRGFSRREVLRYALCGPVLASLGALTGDARAHRPPAQADRLHRATGPGGSDRRGRLRRARWSTCPSYGRAQTSTSSPSPASTRMRCARRVFTSSAATSTASPAGRRRRTSPAGTTAAWPTRRQRFGCTPRREVRTRRRSSSASTRTSTSTPGKALRSNGFEESTRCWACSAPASTAHAGVCGWAIADGVIGQSTTPGYRWAWQTRAWSDGEREPAAVLYQRVIVTASDPGISLGGTHVDEDDILAADFGQWDLAR